MKQEYPEETNNNW